MNTSKSLFAVTLAIVSLTLAVSAKADTVKARCDIYPKGSDRVKSTGSCTFSQRQGAVGIQLQSGKRYDLRPVGNRPNTYRDQNGRAAYRENMGDMGQIYRLANESIYVYWQNEASTQPSQPSQPKPSQTAGTPVTKMTRRNANQIAVQITEGDFNFSGVLTRTSGNTFQGSDGRARVIYDRGAGRVTIINPVTGDEFYNYRFTDVNEGSL